MTLTVDQERAVRALYRVLPPVRLRYCPLTPTPRQEAFLRLDAFEALFGGAAAGGKTIALLMDGLQFADVPGYHALYLRPSLAELQLPGGLIPLSHDWLAGTKAAWNGELKQWRFPGSSRTGADGATLTFGYLDTLADAARYSGASFSYLAFDELGQFTEGLYRRMLRVLRQPTHTDPAVFAPARDGTRLPGVPVRVRSASNPGGPNHGWIKARFVDPHSRHQDAVFLPARMVDNPFIDRANYAKTLSHLTTADRERLVNGDWEIPDEGELFQRGWFHLAERRDLPEKRTAVRFWDLAATEPSAANPDPDYTVGLRLERDLDPAGGLFYVTDIVRDRKAAGAIEHLVADSAARDGHAVRIQIEQEPGGAGRALTDRYVRHVLKGYAVKPIRPTGAKDVRARLVAAAAENGLIRILPSAHLNDFLDEVAAFPHAPHDDCVDALAGAHKALGDPLGKLSIHVPRGNIYDIANRARQRRHGHRINPDELRRQHQLEPHHTARLASQLGLHNY